MQITGKTVERVYRVWEMTNSMSGKGSFDKCTRLMTQHLSIEDDSGPFPRTGLRAAHSTERNAKLHSRSLRSVVIKIFQDVYRQLAGMIEEEQNRNAAENTLREAFREYLEVANPKIEALKAKLEDIRRTTRG